MAVTLRLPLSRYCCTRHRRIECTQQMWGTPADAPPDAAVAALAPVAAAAAASQTYI
jgi:hypothetical protein